MERLNISYDMAVVGSEINAFLFSNIQIHILESLGGYPPGLTI